MWCKKKSKTTKKETQPRQREEIYFMLKALQFKSGSRDAFNIFVFIFFRLMIYLSFRSIIPKSREGRMQQYLCVSRNYPLAYEIKVKW